MVLRVWRLKHVDGTKENGEVARAGKKGGKRSKIVCVKADPKHDEIWCWIMNQGEDLTVGKSLEQVANEKRWTKSSPY